MGFRESHVLCPSCLHELRSGDMVMACPICGTHAEPTAMDLLRHRPPRCGKKGCGGIASVRLCRFCKSPLPADFLGCGRHLRFSLLGVTGAGKTNFLTTMLHELRSAAGSPWVASPMDSQTADLFRENDRAVYERGEPAAASPAGVAPPPQIWRIRDRTMMTSSFIPSYSMTIFDGAGEDCERINRAISRYIDGSKALVILIDPLSLPGVARTISSDVLSWSTTASHGADVSADMVDGLANYVRQGCGLVPGKLINRDVAVVFTKIDAVRESFGTATVMQSSPHLAAGGFVKADADAVDAEIRDWLESRGESAFLNAIETNFRADKIRFFGVSSFGHPPTGSSRLGRVVPHRVLDPLVWMLSKEHIVRTV